MDMYPEHGLGRSLLTALNTIGRESGHPELGNAKLIVLGFSGTGAYFGHFVAYSPDRVLAAILANPGANDPDNVDKIRLDQNGVAVPELIIVGGVDTISGTAKPLQFLQPLSPKGSLLGLSRSEQNFPLLYQRDVRRTASETPALHSGRRRYKLGRQKLRKIKCGPGQPPGPHRSWNVPRVFIA